MNVLFVHQNYPAQFGHVARRLARLGWRCAFASTLPPSDDAGVRRLQYRPRGGATSRGHHCARGFENAVAHAHGVYEECRRHPELRPDLVVGHSGFGSTLFLRELFGCPIVNYFEYYYHPHGTDLDFRPEFPPQPSDVMRATCRNAMILLDLENCTAGYSPTRWQRGLLPVAYRDRVEVIFDGVETEVWHRREGLPRVVPGEPGRPPRQVPAGTRVVSYVARGFEAIRGFDVFMRVARRIYRAYPDVLFVVVGSDKVFYGGDQRQTGGRSFRDHVLAQDDYDLSRFVFTGALPAERLAEVLSLADVHLYFTVPFVLSWSLFDALACGCVVVASDTPPVAELVRHGHNGLLAGFYDVEGLADLAVAVLRDPVAHRPLGDAAAALIQREYTLERTLPRMIDLYRRAVRCQESGR